MAETDRLVDVNLDDSGLPTPAPIIAQERAIAIFDLLEENKFGVVDIEEAHGPYRLNLAIREGRLVFDVRNEQDDRVHAFHLSLTAFRQVIKDYFQICDSYYDAVKRLQPGQIEAIDMGRRGIHNEGSRILLDRLDGKVETDMETARRLFTLIAALHFKG